MLSRRRMLQGTATLAAGSLLRSKSSWAQNTAPVTPTNSGLVRGFIDEGVLVFKGIPYGSDTAKYRFRPPVRPMPWVGVRDAVAYGPQAPQPLPKKRQRDAFSPLDEIGPVNSEDCLHLSVWTASVRSSRKRPVLVYLHGGKYAIGSSNGPVYNGVQLVKRGDVVVVTVNHRLNLFGYLSLRELGGIDFADSGNVGQLDLILALEWVRDNIAAFGGDPKQVTIFGQGGGAQKCTTLMAMPRAKGLFQRVVAMSGQQVTATTPEHAAATTKTVLATLGLTRANIGDILDPAKFPMEKLISAIPVDNPFGPVRDGRTLPHDPFSPEVLSLSAHVPLIMGVTHDETRMILGEADASLFSLQWENLPNRLEPYRSQFGSLKVENIVALYRQWYPSYSASDVFFAVTTAFENWHGFLIASGRRAMLSARAGAAPTWVYEFDWKSPVDGGKWGAAHAMDLPFVFDNVSLASSMTGNGVEAQQLAQQMSETLIAFAQTGDPNNASIPKWSHFDIVQRATMCWDTTTQVKSDPRSNERKLVTPVPYAQPGT